MTYSKHRDDDRGGSKPQSSKYDRDDDRGNSKKSSKDKYDRDDDDRGGSKPQSSKYDRDDDRGSSKKSSKDKYDRDDDDRGGSKPQSSKYDRDDDRGDSKKYGKDKYDRDDDCDDRDGGSGSTNHKASISGTTTGSVTEDSSSKNVATGKLTVSDKNRGEDKVQAISSKSGTYGTFSIDSSGNWSYKLDNSRSATQKLDGDDKVQEKFTVYSKDGSASSTIIVTVNGADEAPQSGGGSSKGIGGTDSGTVKEDETPDTTGGRLTLNGKEVSSGFVADTDAGAYGTLKLSSNGTWTYQLDNSKASVQALNEGQSVTETFTVKAKIWDGCQYKILCDTITITVLGTNEGSVIGGTLVGSVVEDGNAQSAATGALTGATFVSFEGLAGAYGSINLTETGLWDYALDNSLDVVQALAQGETVQEVFTVESTTGVTKELTITVRGTNDAPVAADDFAFCVADSFGFYSTPLSINVLANDTDIDNAAVLQVMGLPALSTRGASLSLNADGTVRYDANDVDSEDNAQTDTFTYECVDEFGAISVAQVTVTLVGTALE